VVYAYEHPNADTFPEFASFEATLEEIGRLGQEDRIVFVIDEYPYLAEVYDAISSRLEHYADVFGKGRSYYFVIFSLSGFTSELTEYTKNNRVKLIMLADMYRIV
jgi:hypothetical protein